MKPNHHNLIEKLFTVVISFDSDLTIQHVSDFVKEHCPAIQTGLKITDQLIFHRPREINTYNDLINNIESLFMLISPFDKFAFRGQILKPDDGNLCVFAGSPWMAWMEKNSPEKPLNLNAFPKHDSQLDQGFLIATQKNMLQDMQFLNNELHKAKQQAEIAFKSRTDLFAVMSHEMRTPLNGIITSLSLLQDGDTDISADNLVDMAETSAKNLLEVINHVLDFSKLEADKLVVEHNQFDLRELVDSVLSILYTQAIHKNIDLQADLDKKLPQMLYGDDSKIRQVLINLVGNAVKFTNSGNVTIRVSVSAEESGIAKVHIEVRDTGPGIDESNAKYLFEPFFSAGSYSRKSSQASSGLGLNICKRIIEMMDGEIGYQTEIGKGSTFWFDLPLEIVTTEPKNIGHGQKKTIEELMNRTYSGRVLLVDDNQINLILGQALLEKYGAKVSAATSGMDAIEIAKKIQFDLILMDITMPELDGIETTKRIKNTSINSVTPVIAVTANTLDTDIQEFLNHGMDGYLPKPINKKDLLQLLQEWLIISDKSVNKVKNQKVSNHLLNRETFLQVRNDIGEESFPRVVDVFLNETTQRFRKMMQAWKTDDLKTLRLEAHTLYSSVLSMGADSLAASMRDIETAVKNQSIGGLQNEKETIHKLFDQTISSINQANRELHSP